MKKNFLLIAILALVMFSCGLSDTEDTKENSDDRHIYNTETAIEYHEDMVRIQERADRAFVEIWDAVDSKDWGETVTLQVGAWEPLDKAYYDVVDLGEFDGSDEYQEAFYDLLDVYSSIIESDIEEMLDYFWDFESLSEEELAIYTELYDDALQKHEASLKDFRDFQQEFADEWEFELE